MTSKKDKILEIEGYLTAQANLIQKSSSNSRKNSRSNSPRNTPKKNSSQTSPSNSIPQSKISVKNQKLLLNNDLRKCCITQHGLVSHELRAKVWPLILNIDVNSLPRKPNRDELREKQSKDLNQVQLDVDRCLSRLPDGLSKIQQEVLQDQLIDLILWVLARNEGLNYYQGYHDIAITILQVTGLRLAMPVVEKLTIDYLQDFMQPTMESTKHVLALIYPIIKEVDPFLHDFLLRSEVGSFFALSWLLTWYGHVIKNMNRTCRIYDFLLACHPVMPIYLATEILIYRREQILDTDCDMPSVHHVLTSLAKEENLPDELLIEQAVRVFIEIPPSELVNEPDHEEEMKFYQSLVMAKSREKTEILEDSIANKSNVSSGNLENSDDEQSSALRKRKNNFNTSTSLNSIFKRRSNNSENDPQKLTKSRSYIEERRKENLEKSKYRIEQANAQFNSQNKSVARNNYKIKKFAFGFVSAVAVGVISYWVQRIM